MKGVFGKTKRNITILSHKFHQKITSMISIKNKKQSAFIKEIKKREQQSELNKRHISAMTSKKSRVFRGNIIAVQKITLVLAARTIAILVTRTTQQSIPSTKGIGQPPAPTNTFGNATHHATPIQGKVVCLNCSSSPLFCSKRLHLS